MGFEMYSPTPIIFGAGKFKKLKNQPMPGKRALIVISNDRIAEKLGFLKTLTAQLDEMRIEHSIFDDVQPNPVISNVMDGAAMARENACDFVISLGGGSVSDASKAISLMTRNEGYYWDYVTGALTVGNPRLPVITITTTAGTGSEIAPFFVITNEELNAKVGFPNPMRYDTHPVLAIVDPELMKTIPADLTAYQGMDSFAHCAESMIGIKSNDLSEMYCLSSIQAIANYLPKAVKDGNDIEARSQIAFSSICSGVVMSLGSSISKHSLEHAMSAYHNELPHGEGLLMICRAYYKYMIDTHTRDEQFIKMARVMGAPESNDPYDFMWLLERLMTDCRVDKLKMSDFNISRDEFPTFVHNARTTSIGYLFTRDPVIMSDDDCLKIYERSFC